MQFLSRVHLRKVLFSTQQCNITTSKKSLKNFPPVLLLFKIIQYAQMINMLQEEFSPLLLEYPA